MELTVIILAAAALFIAGYELISKCNYIRNAKAELDPELSTDGRIVNDQNGARGRAFRYGLYPAAHNACEAIAVHNAKLLLGIGSSLPDTVMIFQSSFAMIGFGLIGSDVFAIGRVLKREGIGHTRIGLDGMTRPGVYIISYWTGRPLLSTLHTVAVSYDGDGWTTYNKAGHGAVSNMPPSDYAAHFVCGYYLKTRQNSQGIDL